MKKCFDYDTSICNPSLRYTPPKIKINRKDAGVKAMEEVEKKLENMTEEEYSKTYDSLQDPTPQKYNHEDFPLDRLMGQLVNAVRFKENHEFIKPFLDKCLEMIEKS